MPENGKPLPLGYIRLGVTDKADIESRVPVRWLVRQALRWGLEAAGYGGRPIYRIQRAEFPDPNEGLVTYYDAWIGEGAVAHALGIRKRRRNARVQDRGPFGPTP